MLGIYMLLPALEQLLFFLNLSNVRIIQKFQFSHVISGRDTTHLIPRSARAWEMLLE
jgi:hypothetical protein